jgi:hypothetical protein
VGEDRRIINLSIFRSLGRQYAPTAGLAVNSVFTFCSFIDRSVKMSRHAPQGREREENSSNSGSYFFKMLRQPRQQNDSSHHSVSSQKRAPNSNSARVTCYEDEMRKEELGRVAQVSSLEFVVEDTIAIGFLKFYCELQFNVENIYFIVEAGKLRDIFAVDAASWSNKDWKAIDKDVGLANLPVAEVGQVPHLLKELQSKKILWPSSIVSRSEVEHKVLWIWETFFSSTGTHEICVPHHVLQNTIKRIFLLHIYGPKAFEEALLDPLKTLKRDIYPRFIVSDLASEMRSRITSISLLPPAHLLMVSPPAEPKVCAKLTDEEQIDELLVKMELPEVLIDNILYEAFLSYLQTIVSSENLLCVRMIEYFKELTPDSMTTKGGSLSSSINNYYRFESINQAWLIYLYFVHPGSAYEVGLSHRRRKEVRLSMANPTRNMFDRLEKSAMEAVKVHFRNFKNSYAVKSKIKNNIVYFMLRREEEKALAIKNAERAKARCFPRLFF